MRRAQLEQLLRELHELTGWNEIEMVGSQCMHAATDHPPAEVLMSLECDVLVEEGELSERIDERLGQGTEGNRRIGAFVDTVPASFPYLPQGWEDRARVLDVGVLRARCLEPDDLAISKLAAGRLKDTETVAALIMEKLVDPAIVRARILEIADLHLRAVLLARLQLVLENCE